MGSSFRLSQVLTQENEVFPADYTLPQPEATVSERALIPAGMRDSNTQFKSPHMLEKGWQRGWWSQFAGSSQAHQILPL